MTFTDIVTLVAFAILGPALMVFHLLLYAALQFWRRHVAMFYVIYGIAWVGWIVGTMLAAPWLLARAFTPPTVLVVPATALALLVLCIAPWAAATIGWRRFFVYAVLRPDRVPTSGRVVGGPFRFLRHPAYTAYRIAAALLLIATGSWGMIAFALASLALFPFIVRLEERELAQRIATA